MLRGLLVVVCLAPACAARAPSALVPRSPAGHADLALSAVVEAHGDSTPPAGRRLRRVGRLSPPFAMGAPARNVLARAPASSVDRDFASR
jgi:hypothetical protein